MSKKKNEVGELSVFPSAGEGFTELSRTPQGRRFEKHILTKGKLLHPTTGNPIDIDDDFVNKLKNNFTNKVCDIVQVPLAGTRNEHTEDPDRNIGEVVDVVERDNKVYAVIDARDVARADKLGKTLIGASAMLHTNYKDTRTGKLVGPTLLHVAVTNRPYVVGLEDYREIVSASNENGDTEDIVVYNTEVEKTEDLNSDSSSDETQIVSASATIQETNMTLEEALANLKAEHGIDVPALQAAAEDAASLSNEVEELAKSNTELSLSLANVLKEIKDTGVSVELSNTDEAVPGSVVVDAVVQLANRIEAGNERIQKLELAAAETEVDALVTSGHVLPTQKATLVKLKLSDAEAFTSLIPAEPVVKMSNEQGVVPTDDSQQKLNIDDEIARLTQTYAEKNK